MVEEILSIVRAQAGERERRGSTTDELLLKFLPALQSALHNDPNYSPDPELMVALKDIETSARLDSIRRRGFTPLDSYQRSIFDFAATDSEAHKSVPGSNESASKSVEPDHQVEDKDDENADS
jgi:hypothetical protein